MAIASIHTAIGILEALKSSREDDTVIIGGLIVALASMLKKANYPLENAMQDLKSWHNSMRANTDYPL